MKTCAKCGKPADAGMRERVANGDPDICEPCYRFEYNLDPELTALAEGLSADATKVLTPTCADCWQPAEPGHECKEQRAANRRAQIKERAERKKHETTKR